MILADVYQVLTGNDKIAKGDDFALASIAAEHVWGPCVSFVGYFVREVSQGDRIIFRRRIARDEVQV